MEKLYVLVRRDLSREQQAVQSAHAAINFVMEHADKGASWFGASNTLALLSVHDEAELLRIADRANFDGISLSLFREPDIGNAATALALEPGKASAKLCRKLTLLTLG